jgi:hypothetical protein
MRVQEQCSGVARAEMSSKAPKPVVGPENGLRRAWCACADRGVRAGCSEEARLAGSANLYTAGNPRFTANKQPRIRCLRGQLADGRA